MKMDERRKKRKIGVITEEWNRSLCVCLVELSYPASYIWSIKRAQSNKTIFSFFFGSIQYKRLRVTITPITFVLVNKNKKQVCQVLSRVGDLKTSQRWQKKI